MHEVVLQQHGASPRAPLSWTFLETGDCSPETVVYVRCEGGLISADWRMISRLMFLLLICAWILLVSSVGADARSRFPCQHILTSRNETLHRQKSFTSPADPSLVQLYCTKELRLSPHASLLEAWKVRTDRQLRFANFHRCAGSTEPTASEA